MQSILLFTHVVRCTLNVCTSVSCEFSVCTSVSCEFVNWIVDCKLNIHENLYIPLLQILFTQFIKPHNDDVMLTLVNETTQAFCTVGLVQRALTKNPGPSWERIMYLIHFGN